MNIEDLLTKRVEVGSDPHLVWNEKRIMVGIYNLWDAIELMRHPDTKGWGYVSLRAVGRLVEKEG